MWPMSVVVLEVLGEDGFELTMGEDQNPIEALPAYGPDEALCEGRRLVAFAPACE